MLPTPAATPAKAGPSSPRPRGGTSAGSPRDDRGPVLGPLPTWTSRSSRSLRQVAFDPLVPKLRADHDRLDQGAESAALGVQPAPHGGDGLIIRRDRRAAQPVGEEL